jgi:hypothetical protein
MFLCSFFSSRNYRVELNVGLFVEEKFGERSREDAKFFAVVGWRKEVRSLRWKVF